MLMNYRVEVDSATEGTEVKKDSMAVSRGGSLLAHAWVRLIVLSCPYLPLLVSVTVGVFFVF